MLTIVDGVWQTLIRGVFVWWGGHKPFAITKIHKCLNLSYLMENNQWKGQTKEYKDISGKDFETPSGNRTHFNK